jgi:putative Ca2+/H+ antiporter (TMEM165/GDT1 family)
VNFGIALATFAVIFPAELPDKTMIANLVLGSKYKPQHVYAGVVLALAAQVVIAVAAGRILGLLPHRLLQLVLALLFAAGAVMIVKEQGGRAEAENEVRRVKDAPPFWKVGTTAFVVVFLAEFGDLTQIATANLAAKFNNPVSVGVGSVFALWLVGAIGVWGGRNVLRIIPMKLFTGIASFLLALFAVISLVGAFSG